MTEDEQSILHTAVILLLMESDANTEARCFRFDHEDAIRAFDKEVCWRTEGGTLRMWLREKPPED